MKRFFVLFWATAVSVAGLVGLYLTADDLGLLWAFWLVLAVAVAVGGARPAWKFVGEAAGRQRNYPKLLERVATAEQKNEDLLRVLSEAKELTAEVADVALREGRSQVLAWVSGKGIAEAPTISSVAVESGELTIAARYNGPTMLTPRERFTVVQRDTGEDKGALVVSRVDGDRGLVYMRLIENRAPDFWDGIRQRAVSDPSPPEYVELLPYRLTTSRTFTSKPRADLDWKDNV